ncbi:MAG: hypothetical protein LBQ41_01415 [Candidatus Ancillula sp.]|nr:hypothetical protein [Candidatus Ancillula sp.]
MLNKLYKQRFWLFFSTTLIMSAVYALSNMATLAIVGQFVSSDAMAAQSTVAPVTQVFAVVYFTFCVGGSTLASLAKGAKDPQKANLYFSIGFGATVVTALLVTVFGLLLFDLLANLLTGGNDELLELTKTYLLPVLICGPFFSICGGAPYLMRIDNQPKLAAVSLALPSLLFILLTYVFVAVFDFGIFGAGLAYGVSYFLGTAVFVYYLLLKARTLSFIKIRRQQFSKAFWGTFARGGSIGVATVLISVKMVTLNNVAQMAAGADGIKAYAVCNQCFFFFSIIISSTSQSTTPMLGEFIGKGERALARALMRYGWLVLLLLTGFIVLVMEFFPSFFVHIFGVTDPLEAEMASYALRVVAISYLGTAFAFMMVYYLQTIGKKAFALTVSITEGALVLLPVAYIFGSAWGFYAIWYAFWVGEIATLALCLVVSLLPKNRTQYGPLTMLPRVTELTSPRKRSWLHTHCHLWLYTHCHLWLYAEDPVGTARLDSRDKPKNDRVDKPESDRVDKPESDRRGKK